MMLLPLLLVAAGVAVSAAASAHADSETEKLLRALDARLQLAVLQQDTRTLDQLLSDDWILISSTGRTFTRAAFLAAVTDPESRLEVNQPSEVAVRVHGSAAIVTALLHERGSEHGVPHEAWLRYTDTWVLEGGAWRYVAGHACRVQPPDEAR
jgi:ketosteroid isomerase-like protein